MRIGIGIKSSLLTANLGTANCQLSNPKCMTASVYPHLTQLLLLAVKPSKTLLVIRLLLLPRLQLLGSSTIRCWSSLCVNDFVWEPSPVKLGNEPFNVDPDPRCPKSKTPAIPLSLSPSLSTAPISFLMHSDTSWNNSWASWCSRELNKVEDVLGRCEMLELEEESEKGGGGEDRALMILCGRRE